MDGFSPTSRPTRNPRSRWIALTLLLSACTVPAAAQTPAPDPARLSAQVGHAVCTVTAENAWGVPVAVANGFAIGDGRFVVTDLGAVARPGVTQATVTFSGGRPVAAEAFGFADVGLGMVALEVRGGSAGLPLAGALPLLDGRTPVAIVGHEWGKGLRAAVGRLWAGPSADDVASRARISRPPGAGEFLRMAGGALEAASGAPVVDAGGKVLAIHLRVDAAGINVPLAMPARSLRQSLLAATPDLRPLAALPTPRWPVQTLRVTGEPPKPAGFAGARARIQEAMVCSRCRGRGKVRMEVAGGVTEDTVECPRCHGEGVALESGLYDLLATWALEGTRAVWAPGPVGRVHTAARAAGREMLAHLAKAGQHFRGAFAERTARDVNRLGQSAPRGLIVYAEVRETIRGPDGPYVILDPVDTNYMVAVRLSDLMGRDGRGAAGLNRRPPDRAWVLLAGAVVSDLDGAPHRGVCVLPFAWTGCPTPGPVGRP